MRPHYPENEIMSIHTYSQNQIPDYPINPRGHQDLEWRSEIIAPLMGFVGTISKSLKEIVIRF